MKWRFVLGTFWFFAGMLFRTCLRRRIAANESSAASSVRTVNTAEVSYLTTYPASGYSAALANLGPGAGACPNPPVAATACLIDRQLSIANAAPGKNGFLVNELGGTP